MQHLPDPMSPPNLDPNQARVLGCLLEKQVASSNNYPMTVTKLLAACNQKIRRAPLMQLDKEQVQRALAELQLLNLVEADLSGRVVRFRHHLVDKLSNDSRLSAILAVLLLQGPLSPAQIRNSARTLHQFETIEEIESLLADCDLFSKAGRRPKQRGDRYRHTLKAIDGSGNLGSQPLAASTPTSLATAKPTAAFRLEGKTDTRESMSTVVDELKQLQMLLAPTAIGTENTAIPPQNKSTRNKP